MDIKSEHRNLLKKLGLKEKDFELFKNKTLKYEFDKEKGVRIHDPYYDTSYNEYIGIDGWSAWSSEDDKFMSNILSASKEAVLKSKFDQEALQQDKISTAIQKKFGAAKTDFGDEKKESETGMK